MKSRKHILITVFAVLLEFCVMYGIILFQRNFVIVFPLAVRSISVMILQWVLLIVPVSFMKISKESLFDYGFTNDKIGMQIVTGILVGAAFCVIFTLLPILLGFKEMVGQTSYTEVWQFCYEFIYMIFGVALVEEFFYRGFLFKRLQDISDSKWFPMIVSSIVFGFSHIFNGSMIQVVTTSILGIVFCVCRYKIKNCSTLSLIIAHGMHNALIVFLVSIL